VLIVTIGLLLVAAVTLVVGFVEHSLALIYVSIAASAVCVVILVVFTALNRTRGRAVTVPSVGRPRREVAGSETDAMLDESRVDDNRPTQLVEAVSPPASRRGPRGFRGSGRKGRAEKDVEIDESEYPAEESEGEVEPLPAVVPVRRSYLASSRRAAAEDVPSESDQDSAEPELLPERVPARRSLLGSRRKAVTEDTPPEPAQASVEPESQPEPVPVRRSLLGSRRKAVTEDTPPEPAQASVEPESQPEPVPVRRSLLGSRRKAVTEDTPPEPAQASVEPDPQPEPVPVHRSLLGSRRKAVADQGSAGPSRTEPEAEPVLEIEPELPEAEPVPPPEPEPSPEPVRRSLLGSRRRSVAVVPSRDDTADEIEAADEVEAAGTPPPFRRARAVVPTVISQPLEPQPEDIDEAELEPLPEPVPVRRSFFGSRRKVAEEVASWSADEGGEEASSPGAWSQETWSQGASSPYADAGSDAVFPIADYDELTVSEVMPLLGELVPDEYDVVRQRELATRGRSTILRRLNELQTRDALLSGVATGGIDASPEAYAEADMFPIADYDDLRAAEILPLLRQLDPEELEVVRRREEAGAARSTVLKRINTIFGLDNGASAGLPRVKEQARPEVATAPRATKAPPRARAATPRATKASVAPTSKVAGARPRKAAGTPAKKAAGAPARKAAGPTRKAAGPTRTGSVRVPPAGAGAIQVPGSRVAQMPRAGGSAIPPTKRPPTGTGPRLVSRRPSPRSGRGT